MPTGAPNASRHGQCERLYSGEKHSSFETCISRLSDALTASPKRLTAGNTAAAGPSAKMSSISAQAPPPNGLSSASRAASSGWMAMQKAPL